MYSDSELAAFIDFAESFFINDKMNRGQFFSLLRAFKGRRIYFAPSFIDGLDTKESIRRKIASGWKRPELIKNLIACHGLKKSTAYNRFKQSLDT